MRAETILIVDENSDDVCLLTHALMRAGVRNPVYWVENIEDAIQYLKGQGRFADRNEFAYPGYLIIDLHLTSLSGFELLDWLKKNPQPELEAVVCTGTVTPSDRELAYASGADYVLEKTASFSQFVDFFAGDSGAREITEELELAVQ